DPGLAAVAVQIPDGEDGVGVGLAVHVLAGLGGLGDRCGDVVGRLSSADWKRTEAGGGHQRDQDFRPGSGKAQFAPLVRVLVLRKVFFLTFASPLTAAAAASVVAFTAPVAVATAPSASRSSVAFRPPPRVTLLRDPAGLPAPHTLSFKCAGPSVSEAWIASPSMLVPNSDFQK